MQQSLEELAAAQAIALLAETPEADGRKLVVRTFSDRDINFLKLFAQKLTRLSPNVVALLGTTSPQPALVFAQSGGQPFDMGARMKEIVGTIRRPRWRQQRHGPGRALPIRPRSRLPSRMPGHQWRKLRRSSRLKRLGLGPSADRIGLLARMACT